MRHISVSYSKVGDQLKIYWDDEPSFADELDERERLTILRAFKDEHAVVGCKVWGLSEVLDKVGLKIVPR